MILHNVHLVECLMAIFEVFQVTASNHWQIRIKECWPETVLWELKKFFTNFLPKKLCKIAKFCLFRSWSSKTMRRNSLKTRASWSPSWQKMCISSSFQFSFHRLFKTSFCRTLRWQWNRSLRRSCLSDVLSQLVEWKRFKGWIYIWVVTEEASQSHPQRGWVHCSPQLRLMCAATSWQMLTSIRCAASSVVLMLLSQTRKGSPAIHVSCTRLALRTCFDPVELSQEKRQGAKETHA